MSDAALTLLKIGLLAFLYLFFAWVLHSSINRLRQGTVAVAGPEVAATPTFGSSEPSATGRITVLEPDELAGSVMQIGDELTIGRAAACSLTLDDTYVSQLHASIVWRDRHYLVEDAGSTNGTFVNRERLVAPVVLQTGDRVQIGSTVLEFS